MSEKLNPYQQLGNYDPFGVANMFGLPFCLAEAFKKLTCAGINGRLKTEKQDYKEAVYSIERAIKDIEKYHLQKTSSARNISDVMGIYNAVFPDMSLDAYAAARNILEFSITGSVNELQKALICANGAAENATN